jgi:putative hemolysin
MPFGLAEDFIKHDESKINLVELDGMLVNEKCKNDSINCFKTLMTLKKMPSKFSQNTDQKGNPASDYCKKLKGKNEILKDKNNNEWDFCELKNGFVIDSWALYKRFKE